MSYEVKVLADSLSPDGKRLTTLECTFPRFILAEINTHRMLSRNSASSRAIPPEKLIERVRTDPFIPETFNKRVKGMGVGKPLEDQAVARSNWLCAADAAATYAARLNRIGLDKSRVNRLLEPFIWHTAIITATEWDNFFALRDHPDAQPEMQKIARYMRDALDLSIPEEVPYGKWHLPLFEQRELYDIQDRMGPFLVDDLLETAAMVSAGRCARVSFDTHENYEEPERSYERAVRLRDSGHLSPFEHVARPINPEDDWPYVQEVWSEDDPPFIGNFKGWVQLRKMIPNEHNFAEVVVSGVE